MLDDKTIARRRLQDALKSVFLRVSAYLDAVLLLQASRLDGRRPMLRCPNACARAAVADALERLVRVFSGARRLVGLQLAPHIRVVSSLAWLQLLLDRRKEA